MKKLIIIVAALGLGSAMTSCKKDYTCECSRVYTGSSSTTSVKEDDYTFKDSKARATDRCNDLETTGTDLNGDYSRECEIK